MSKIVVDATLQAKLRAITQPAELCDEEGNIIGQFLPVCDESQLNLQPQISDEELRRRRQSKENTYTTAEVLAYLEKL